MFKFFKKKSKLTEEQSRWNRMWDLWVEGRIESPYHELMTYLGEIPNGGHAQYFTNVENCGDIHQELSALHQLLPPELSINLQNAYQAYLVLEKRADDAEAEEILKQCDRIYDENEKQIMHLLEAFSEKQDRPLHPNAVTRRVQT